MRNTEFRSHLCFGLCDVSPAFFELQCMHVLGQMVRDVFPICVCVVTRAAVSLGPPLLPQFWECDSSPLGARKIPCPRKNQGRKICLEVQDSSLCIPGLSYSVRCEIMLMLKFDLCISC